MGLELRSLPSTGVTRLPRYYEPLRHPKWPGLALTGVRLSSRDSPLGASRVASDLRVQACHRPYPGGTPGACRVVRVTPLSPRTTAFPVEQPGRLPHRVVSGLARRSLSLRPARSPNRPRRPVVSKASTASLPPPPLR